MSEWAVILGASAGTGAGIARAVAADPGLNLFGTHRGNHMALADALVADLAAMDRRAIMHVGDTALPEGAEAGCDKLLAEAGPRSVKLFVHSMASASVGDFASEGKGRFHQKQVWKTFNVMAHSFIFWVQAMLERDLLAPNARLLGLTNPLDDTLLHNTGLVSASKAALEVYIRHLAMELGPRGMRVNLLKFGTVMTPAITQVYSFGAMERLEARHAEMIPAGRMCTVEEVGRFVSILCGEGVDWFNGATIDFTGGMTLRLLDLVLNDDKEP